MIKKKLTKFSENLINWIGSLQSLFVHTLFFAGIFVLGFSGLVDSDHVFNITTNILSIEAIYLAIFIQMTVNKHSDDLEEVSEDIEELQKDVEEISDDVGEIQEDVEEISEDVGELQEDVEEISEEEEMDQESKFEYIEHALQSLLTEITELKKEKNQANTKNTEDKN